MRNPLMTKVSFSDYSEDSDDGDFPEQYDVINEEEDSEDSDIPEQNDVINEKDNSEDSDIPEQNDVINEKEDSEDSDIPEQNDVINEKDQSENLDATSGSESNHVEQGNSEDSESEDESESESENSSADKDEEFDHKWEELRNEAPDTDEITRRIAVCNMDWDRIRAIDLLVCFNSFKPADGMINSVKIYPSEFGLKRMEEEKIKGPPELVEKTLPVDQEEVEDKKGSKYHREKLRQYQINRLKYYYAVVDCDSPETANAIYEQLNGMEYESSSVRFDLRFIPDDMTFDHKATSVAEEVPSDYKPRLFVTSALQQVKVDLTWDETDPKRREFFQKVFTDIDSVQDDIKDYLASATSESEEEVTYIDDEDADKKMKTKDRIAKYKELLKSIEDKEKQQNEEKIDVEVTWVPALKEKTEEKVKEKIKKDTLNPFEEMLLKKKEQKKIKEKELKKQIQDANSEEDSEEEASETLSVEKSKKDKLDELALISDYKKEIETAGPSSIKKKKKMNDKSDDLDGFVADMNDPRFSAMHTSSLFNMVPSEHQIKKSDGNFGLKRPKERKFKSRNFPKHNKKARHS